MRARRKYRHRATVQFYRDGLQTRANQVREELESLGWKVKLFGRGNESYGKFRIVAHTTSTTPPPIPTIYQCKVLEDSSWTR